MGAHGAFAELVFALTEELAVAAGIETLRIDRFEIADFSLAPRRILLCNYPSNQIVTAIANGDLKVLLLTEPPADTLLFMQGALGIDPLEAIRSQTASAVANLAIGHCSDVRHLERARGYSLMQCCERIVGHLNLSLAPQQCRGPAERLSGDLGCEADVEDVLAQRAELWRKPLDTAVRSPESDRPWTEVCSNVLDGAVAMSRFGSPRPIVWPTEVFTATAPRVQNDAAGVVLDSAPGRGVRAPSWSER